MLMGISAVVMVFSMVAVVVCIVYDDTLDFLGIEFRNPLILAVLMMILSGISLAYLENKSRNKMITESIETDKVCVVKTWTEARSSGNNRVAVLMFLKDHKGRLFQYDEMNANIQGVIEAGRCLRAVHQLSPQMFQYKDRTGPVQLRYIVSAEPIAKMQEPLCN